MCASSSEWGAHAGPSNHISDLANTSHRLVGGDLGRAEEVQTPRGGPSPEACLRKAGSATVASQAGSGWSQLTELSLSGLTPGRACTVSPPRCGSQRNSLTCRPRGKPRLRQPPALPVMADSFPGLQVPRTVEFSAQPGGTSQVPEPLLSDGFSFTNALSRPTSRAPGRGERRLRNQSKARAGEEDWEGRGGGGGGTAARPPPHTQELRGNERQAPCEGDRDMRKGRARPARVPQGSRGHRDTQGERPQWHRHSVQRVLLPEP